MGESECIFRRGSDATTKVPNFSTARLQVVGLCLAGFVAAIRITCLLDMGMLRNTFVTSLARFTALHAPSAMEAKSAKAFRAMLFIADDNANYLHVRS